MSTPTAPERDDLLDELAETRVDTARALARTLDDAAAHRSHRRSVLGSIGALVILALVAALVLLRPGEPTQIVTDGLPPEPVDAVAEVIDEPEAPVVATETTVAPEGPATTPVPSAVVESTTTSPPTTEAPPLPLQVQVTVLTPKVSAGENASLEIGWAAGRVRGTPTFTVDWGDDAVRADTAPAVRCDGSEHPGIGKERANFRYATPGRHPIVVTVETCAPGGVAERVRLEASIDITAPVFDGAPGATVVASLAGPPNSDVGRLDDAVARFTPSEPAAGAPTSVLLGARLPALDQLDAAGSATVLVVPAASRGSLELRWPDRRCSAVAQIVPEAVPGDRPLSVPLTVSC